MEAPTSSLVEVTAGLVAAHADVVVALAADGRRLLAAHGHPFVPVVRCAIGPCDAADTGAGGLDDFLEAAFAGAACKADAYVDFQVARGKTGVSA